MFSTEQIQSLNALELEVYRYVASHLQAVPYMRIRELAAGAHVSTSTVLRFCRKMGCDGYAEFKLRLKDLAGEQAVQPGPVHAEELHGFLSRLERGAFDEDLDRAVSLLAPAEEVLVFGVGNSDGIAHYAARYLSNVGKLAVAFSDIYYPVFRTHPEQSVALVLSASGEVDVILEMAGKLAERGVPIVAVCANSRSTLSRMATVRLSYGTTVTRDGQSIDYTSQVPVVALVEAVARRLGERLLEG